jgi:uncharacterized membrane protein
MESISQATVRNALGHVYQDSFAFLPTIGTSGVLIAANSSHMIISNPSLSDHTITVTVQDLRLNKSWMFTGVYDPQSTLEKKLFIRELRHLKQVAS